MSLEEHVKLLTMNLEETMIFGFHELLTMNFAVDSIS